MIKVLLVQLPIPQLNFGKRTGNIPLGPACLKMAASGLNGVEVKILPESLVSYLGDGALLQCILAEQPDIVGFAVYCWNLERAKWLAGEIKTICSARIIFGGPEITPDNQRISSTNVDFWVFGEGERVFVKLLTEPLFWSRSSAALHATSLFTSAPSPYLSGVLEQDIEEMMLLETQRGCSYRCGFCYYNKSMAGRSIADLGVVTEGVRWAHEQRLKEVYLLDPSLNTHPELQALVEAIGRINNDRHLAISSEIRAETIDRTYAELFAAGGFTLFEIGLQSTNAKALEVMKRPTNLKGFLGGVGELRRVGIRPKIDLIIGLPGDDLAHFQRTIDFVVENGLQEDIQVFPLYLLPGTDFRLNHRRLGLQFAPGPPYIVVSNPTFSQDDMIAAFHYAEERLGLSLHPLPDLDLAYRGGEAEQQMGSSLLSPSGSRSYVSRVFIAGEPSPRELDALAQRLTHPYQVVCSPKIKSEETIAAVIRACTASNPFTPLELVIQEPAALPDTQKILAEARLQRPHFLDVDYRYQGIRAGNRAILFTLVSSDPHARFSGADKRQVFWWKYAELPEKEDLEGLSHLDGILIDGAGTVEATKIWQNRFAPWFDDIIDVSFADANLQSRWLKLTAPAEYYMEGVRMGGFITL
jgi:hypothetical protein